MQELNRIDKITELSYNFYKTTYEDILVYTEIEHYQYHESGHWWNCQWSSKFDGPCHLMEDDSYTSTETYSPTTKVFVEVPKAAAPVIRYDGSKAVITADSGLLIYYSINSGDYKEYTGQITVSEGDVIAAYAIGYGIAQSSTAKETVTGDSANKLAIKVNSSESISSGETFPLQIKNYFGKEKGTLIVKIFDRENNKLESVQSKTATLYSGTNTLRFTADYSDTCTAPYISVFLWDSISGMQPILEKTNLPLNK